MAKSIPLGYRLLTDLLTERGNTVFYDWAGDERAELHRQLRESPHPDQMLQMRFLKADEQLWAIVAQLKAEFHEPPGQKPRLVAFGWDEESGEMFPITPRELCRGPEGSVRIAAGLLNGRRIIVAEVKRRGGRKPELLERVKQTMRNDIKTGKHTLAKLENMKQKELAAEYDCSRERAVKALDVIRSEFVVN